MIIHGREKHHFTQVPNALIKDTRLKPLARLIIIYLIGHVEGWACLHSDIAENLGISEPVVRKSMQQIVAVGYATRGPRVRREHKGGGTHLGEYDYTIYSYSLRDVSECNIPELQKVATNNILLKKSGDGGASTPRPAKKVDDGYDDYDPWLDWDKKILPKDHRRL